MAKAIELADAGDAGAVAAMMALLLGMRASEIVSRVVRDLDDEGRLLWIPDAKTEAGKRTLRITDVLQPYLERLTAGQGPEARIFGEHWRDWIRKSVRRICVAAGGPFVTAHGMRGLHATLALDAGVTGHVVASSLGPRVDLDNPTKLCEARGRRGCPAATSASRALRWHGYCLANIRCRLVVAQVGLFLTALEIGVNNAHTLREEANVAKRATLGALLAHHKVGTWVVLDPSMSRVLGVGRTPESAMKKAHVAPVTNDANAKRPVMLQVPDPSMVCFF